MSNRKGSPPAETLGSLERSRRGGCASPVDDEIGHPRRWTVLIMSVVCLVVVSLDNTILNVALKTIQQDLHATQADMPWAVNSYTLIFPTTLSIITNVFPVGERAKAVGLWSASAGVGIAIGPVTGGYLLEHWRWGSVFLVNVPFVAVGATAIALGVPPHRGDSRSPARTGRMGMVPQSHRPGRVESAAAPVLGRDVTPMSDLQTAASAHVQAVILGAVLENVEAPEARAALQQGLDANLAQAGEALKRLRASTPAELRAAVDHLVSDREAFMQAHHNRMAATAAGDRVGTTAIAATITDVATAAGQTSSGIAPRPAQRRRAGHHHQAVTGADAARREASRLAGVICGSGWRLGWPDVVLGGCRGAPLVWLRR